MLFSLVMILSIGTSFVDSHDWIKNNAGWWANGLIEDAEFVSGLQYLVEQGVIRI